MHGALVRHVRGRQGAEEQEERPRQGHERLAVQEHRVLPDEEKGSVEHGVEVARDADTELMPPGIVWCGSRGSGVEAM